MDIKKKEFADDYVRPILTYPNDKLHEKCTDVTEFNEELEKLGRNLLFSMKAKNGIGLAAPQIGVLKNIIAVWIEDNLPMVFVNPVIVHKSEELMKFNEGCLSVPGYFEDRERSESIVLKFRDTKGGEHEVEFRNLYAFCIQHEVDHLNGTLFIDQLSEFKKQRIKSKVSKNKKFH